MPIKFFIPGYQGGKPKRASYRFRATIPLQSMRPEDGIINDVKQAKKGDIVVLAKKSTPTDLFYLKSNQIKCVYDICDNKWRKYVSPEWIQRVITPHNVICQGVDGIVTTSQKMKDLISKHIGRNSIIIPDPVEATREEPRVALKSKECINIFNYGNHKHFQKIYWKNFISQLFDTEINFKFHCMMDRSKKYKIMYQKEIEQGRLVIYEYNFEKQYELMRMCDIVYLPIVCNSMPDLNNLMSKSPNRIMDAIYSGKPVITNEGVNSWLPFRHFADFIGWARSFDYGANIQAFRALINKPKDEIIHRILRGQEYIKKHHSPEVIGKQWIDLENKVGKLGF